MNTRTIVSTNHVEDPKDIALRFSIILAGDKGVGNEIEALPGGGFDVVADDGKVSRWLPKGKS